MGMCVPCQAHQEWEAKTKKFGKAGKPGKAKKLVALKADKAKATKAAKAEKGAKPLGGTDAFPHRVMAAPTAPTRPESGANFDYRSLKDVLKEMESLPN